MNLNQEQKNFISSHLRRPENDLAIAEIVKKISVEANKVGIDIDSNYAELTALLMNIGETNPDIAYIYDNNFSWKDHPEAKDLNAKHGEYSVNMALEAGIDLTDEQIAIISGHSKNEYPNVLSLIIKSAEICKATESPRWSRGVKKDIAKTWDEVSDILKQEDISPEIISIVSKSYGRERFIAEKSTDTQEPEL